MARLLDNPRPALLDAAERLLLRYGYRRMTVDDLAREANIGKGTVYLHFDSKEEVALRTARALLTGTNWLLPYYQDPSQWSARADTQRRTRDVAFLLVSGARQVLKGGGAAK